MTGPGADDFIPARMINEFVYCQRLFFLEWVDGRFADSDDVAEGRHVHRAVDQETGAAPLPDDGDLVAARSVLLSSTELGVTVRTDLIETDHGRGVVPVDYKRGRPQPDGQPWPPDLAQSLLQIAALREHGYAVTHGELYYASTRQRVRVDVTEARLSWIRDVVAGARRLSQQIDPPPPLVDSNKCPRCSLVGLCLPDETNLLLERTERPPRRILPRDHDQRPVYVTEAGTYVGLRRGRLEVSKSNQVLASYRMIDVSQVAVFGRVQVTSYALASCFAAGIPVLWHSYAGWLHGWAFSPPAKYVQLRRRQTIAHTAGGLGLARRMIEGKIRNCRVLLRRNTRGDVTAAVDTLGRLAAQTAEVADFAQLLGIEGAAARIYFDAFPTMMAPGLAPLADRFAAAGRNRRPPRDPINALLSFAYALLTKDLVAVTLGVGMDPYLGVFHRSRYGRPALALDLAEEFRPLIADSVVVGVLNNGEINAGDFTVRAGGVALKSDARRTLIAAYERRMDIEVTHPTFGYKISYRRVLDVQARILAAALVGELPEYTPMVTR